MDEFEGIDLAAGMPLGGARDRDGGVAPSHLPDRRPPQNEERGLSQRFRVATVAQFPRITPFKFFTLAFLRSIFSKVQSKRSECELCAELKNACRKRLGNLSKTGAANIVHAESVESAPVRLVEGVVGIRPELQAHAFPGQIE